MGGGGALGVGGFGAGGLGVGGFGGPGDGGLGFGAGPGAGGPWWKHFSQQLFRHAVFSLLTAKWITYRNKATWIDSM